MAIDDAGQGKILRSLDDFIAAHQRHETDLADRLARIEERQAMMWKVIIGGGAEVPAVGIAMYHMATGR